MARGAGSLLFNRYCSQQSGFVYLYPVIQADEGARTYHWRRLLANRALPVCLQTYMGDAFQRSIGLVLAIAAQCGCSCI